MCRCGAEKGPGKEKFQEQKNKGVSKRVGKNQLSEDEN